MQKKKNRIICLVLCLVLLVPTTLVTIFALEGSLSTVNEEPKAVVLNPGTAPVTTSETTTQNGIDYTITRQLKYIGNRKYQLKVDIETDLNSTYYTQNRAYANHGIDVVQQSGWYLLELWGGAGGDGEDDPVFKDYGGHGGHGGYVSALVYLEVGQVLVHTIGTNGGTSTMYDDGQGGVNGNGGEHGTSGSMDVGAGGGFSAFYLFDAEEYNESWVTTDSVNIPDEARTSRYIMIAGGGGGGGACSLVINATQDNLYYPNGGYGGTSTGSTAIPLLGSNYDVEGYVFAGRNGYSSGDSTSYVGIGGSTVPGRTNQTALGLYKATETPNDWTGTYNPDIPYGSGGAGNLRGGGGGSGFCGGSGGIMDGSLLATHVGGGGGGSSFIAANVNGKSVKYSFTDQDPEYAYINGYNSQPLGKGTGGACEITYLGKTDENIIDTTPFGNISFNTEINDNFEFISESSASSGTSQMTVSGQSVNVTGLAAYPRTPYSAKTTATVVMVFKAKDAFMGGNEINAIRLIEMSLDDPINVGETVFVTATSSIKYDDVNVPLGFAAKARSHTAEKVGQSFALSSLYTDDFTSIRNNLASYPDYAGIAQIGNYQVYDRDGNLLTAAVAPTVNTSYIVSLEVTLATEPNSDVVVGPQMALTTTLTAVAAIGVVTPGEAIINGLTTNTTKSIAYNNGVYSYNLGVDQRTPGSALIDGGSYIVNTGSEEKADFVAPTDGWYYIQAWGGNGGSGGGATLYYRRNNSGTTYEKSYAGGGGGNGGYVSQYLYLNSGDAITYTLGAAGYSPNGSSSTNTSDGDDNMDCEAVAGGGGTATSVNVRRTDNTSTTVLIAGGGGGGGGAAIASRTKAAWPYGFDSNGRINAGSAGTKGTSASQTTFITTENGTFNGGSGDDGDIYWDTTTILSLPRANGSGGDGGSAGSNYKNTSFGTTQNGQTLSVAAQELASRYAPSSGTSGKSISGGQVAVTLVESADMVAQRNKLNGLEAKFVFSRYFDVNSVNLTTSISGTGTRTTNGDGSVTVTYKNSSYSDPIASFTYKTETAADGISTLLYIYSCTFIPDFTIDGDPVPYISYSSGIKFTVALTPREGFLGGNDVPVLGGERNSDGTLKGTSIDGVTDTQDDANPDRAVRVMQASSSADAKGGYEYYNVPEVDHIDYANVESDFDVLTIFEANDKTVKRGESVSKAELYSFNPPVYSQEDAWCFDFVKFTAPTDASYSPTVTTPYEITASAEPKSAPQKAQIGIEAAASTATLTSTVYVEQPVTYDFTHLTSDGLDYILYQDGLDFVIEPEAGYLLPDSIEVSADGLAVDPSLYTYDTVTGAVSVQGSAVTGEMVITATAKIQTYYIHYVYTTPLGGETEEIYPKDTADPTKPASDGYPAGSPVDTSAVTDAISAQASERAGYVFKWIYETSDGNAPTVMPAKDLYIYGSYHKAEYDITVKYVYENGTKAKEDDVYKVLYLDSYSFEVPEITGYLPDISLVSGTVSTPGNAEITVTYTASSNILRIIYVDKHNNELAREPDMTFATDEAFSVTPTVSITGYTTPASVTGVMNGNASQIIYVECAPKTFNLSFMYAYAQGSYAAYPDFDFSGATMADAEERKIEFGSSYGYDPTLGYGSGLPVPLTTGFEFDGWYKDEALAERVEAIDTVNAEGDVTLYAKWKPQEFQLTVRYEFLYTDADFLPEELEAIRAKLEEAAAAQTALVPYGDTYTVTPVTFEGYAPYIRFSLSDQAEVSVISGTMPASQRIITITYEIRSYTVSFKDQPGQYITYSDIADVDPAIPGQDAFDMVWEEQIVKHGVAPVYTDIAPTHSTREEYTYSFIGWVSSLDGTRYAGATPAFPVVESDVTYYTEFTASENIVEVYFADTLQAYFTSVSDALVFAESADASADVRIKLRRNAGNESKSELKLDGDTFKIGNTYAGTGSVLYEIDLGGLKAYTTSGEAVIENTVNSVISITVTDTEATPGSIEARSDGNVVAVRSAYGPVLINKAIAISVVSANGNATALEIGTSSAATIQFTASVSLSAEAGNGTATALKLIKNDSARITLSCGSSNSNASTFTATGKTAIGIDAGNNNLNVYAARISATATDVSYALKDPATFSTNSSGSIISDSDNTAYGITCETGTFQCPSTSLPLTVTAENAAYGIDISAGASAYLSNGSAMSTPVSITSAASTAYGIRNAGTLSSVATYITVFGEGDAYGLYNTGAVTVSGVSTLADIRAESASGIGYGFYSDGGICGSDSEYLSSGAFAGSTYGIYCEDSSIYIKGNNIYFKGSSEANSVHGAVIHPDYSITEANSPRTEYWRLAMLHTITFVTNGGTPIASISQLYDTPLTVPTTTKLGYNFASWYINEDLSTKYTVPARMPDSTFTVYAGWDLIDYTYTLDTESTGITIKFYKNTSSSDSTIVATIDVGKEPTALPDSIKDLTYQSPTSSSNSKLYLHTGWYTSRTASLSTYVDMSGNLSAYDTDGDGVVNLYAGWTVPSGQYVVYDMPDRFREMGIGAENEATMSISGWHGNTSSYGSGFMYYKVPCDGRYMLTYANFSSATGSNYDRYMVVYRVRDGILTTVINESRLYATTAKTYLSTPYIDCQMGDVILVRLRRYTGTDKTKLTNISAYVTPEGDISGYNDYLVYGKSKAHFTYNVEMGDLALPLLDNRTNPGNRFAGWSQNGASSDPANMLAYLTPDMINTTVWSTGGVVDLYSNWAAKTYSEYISGSRDFSKFTTAFDMASPVFVRDNSTVTLRFTASTENVEKMIFKFASGLPEGTVLTLVDRAAEASVFYTYTVPAGGISELDSTAFTNMQSGAAFSGLSSDILLQICYRTATVTADEEIVHLHLGSDVFAYADISFKLIDSAPASSTLGDSSVNINESGSISIPHPALSGKGFDNTDKVMILISLGSDKFVPGTVFTAGSANGVFYGSGFILIDTGKTVQDLLVGSSIDLTYSFPTSNLKDLNGKTVTYKVLAAPAADFDQYSPLGLNSETVATVSQVLTVTQNPAVSSDKSSVTVGKGSEISVVFTYTDRTDASGASLLPELYIYSITDNGTLKADAASTSLFDGITVTEDGKLVTDGGETIVLTDKTFTANVSPDAAHGAYCLKFVYGDKYIYVGITVY